LTILNSTFSPKSPRLFGSPLLRHCETASYSLIARLHTYSVIARSPVPSEVRELRRSNLTHRVIPRQSRGISSSFYSAILSVIARSDSDEAISSFCSCIERSQRLLRGIEPLAMTGEDPSRISQ